MVVRDGLGSGLLQGLPPGEDAAGTSERSSLASIPGSWCPIRTPQIPGARVPCEDSCALYIATSKLPPTHSCALTALGIYALQRIVVPQQAGPGAQGAGRHDESDL